MSMIRPIGAVLAVAGSRTPVFTGTVIPAVTFSIKNGIATIVLGAGNLPSIGYCGPNPYLVGSESPAGGQQVTLWGFTTATYFNGKTITVLRNNTQAGSFSFFFAHADVNSTADAGNTAAAPTSTYRVVRLECGQGLGTDLIYVGDGNVSSTKYMAALSLAGQLAVEISGDNIPADRIFIDTNGGGAGDTVQVTLIH